MKHTLYNITLLLLALAATACVTDERDDPQPPRLMALSTRNVGDGTSTDTDTPEACLLFWTQSQLNGNEPATTDRTPYYRCTLAESALNDYKTGLKKYNTGKSYPLYNEAVHAAGFSPATLPHLTAGNYGDFVLPARDGTDSLVLASNGIRGNNFNGFAGEMQFRPATVRFIVKAKRNKETMAVEGTPFIYVKDVKVTFPALLTPNLLRWSPADRCYKATHDNTSSGMTDAQKARPAVADGTGLPQLLSEGFSPVDTVYLAPQPKNADNTAIAVTLQQVKALYSFGKNDFPAGDPAVVVREWPGLNRPMTVPLKDKEGNPVYETHAGDSYEIRITFSYPYFEIEAVETDWIYGGSLQVPVIDNSISSSI